MQPKIELKSGQTIVFIGDSITDADRSSQAYRPFGYGYVHFLANTILAKYPCLNLHIVNTGVSGNTIRDLKRRWERDCIRYKPDILSILIGINDVWGRFADPQLLPSAVYADEYELTYKQLISQVKQQFNCQLVLMEPFMFCDNPQDEMLKNLVSYIDIVVTLAEEFAAVLVPLQKKINEKIQQVPPEKWSSDSVHPYVWAHCWIAQRWLESTGL